MQAGACLEMFTCFLLLVLLVLLVLVPLLVGPPHPVVLLPIPMALLLGFRLVGSALFRRPAYLSVMSISCITFTA